MTELPDKERRKLKARWGADPNDAAQNAALDKIIDGALRDPRLRRTRALRIIAAAEAAGVFLYEKFEEVVDAAQHHDAERHERDLRESARLLNLVADKIAKKELRRLK